MRRAIAAIDRPQVAPHGGAQVRLLQPRHAAADLPGIQAVPRQRSCPAKLQPGAPAQPDLQGLRTRWVRPCAGEVFLLDLARRDSTPLLLRRGVSVRRRGALHLDARLNTVEQLPEP